MTPRNIRILNLVLVGLAVSTFLIFCRLAYLQLAYERRFDESRLLGQTKNQIEVIVGKPEFVVDDQIWMYQSGMSPDAFLTFKDDKLVMLEKVKYR